jgi:hypothetical protein
MTEQELVLQVMAAGHGHKDMRYDPKNKAEVKKIKEYIKKKLAEGWVLYGMKAGDSMMEKLANARDIDKIDLDRFILSGKDKIEKKLLAQPNTGG